jgi:hypothetical protein
VNKQFPFSLPAPPLTNWVGGANGRCERNLVRAGRNAPVFFPCPAPSCSLAQPLHRKKNSTSKVSCAYRSDLPSSVSEPNRSINSVNLLASEPPYRAWAPGNSSTGARPRSQNLTSGSSRKQFLARIPSPKTRRRSTSFPQVPRNRRPIFPLKIRSLVAFGTDQIFGSIPSAPSKIRSLFVRGE